jgi:hypothetical protein
VLLQGGRICALLGASRETPWSNSGE